MNVKCFLFSYQGRACLIEILLNVFYSQNYRGPLLSIGILIGGGEERNPPSESSSESGLETRSRHIFVGLSILLTSIIMAFWRTLFMLSELLVSCLFRPLEVSILKSQIGLL